MERDPKIGWTTGLSTYALWGLFPLYFVLFDRTNPFELVAHRVLWSLVFCLLLLAATRSFGDYVHIWKDRRTALLMVAAGFLITANWTTYVSGVLSGKTLEAALGYFVNPLAVIAMGVVLFKEQLRPLQRVALLFGALAVVVMIVAYGEVPWIALALTFTFGTYTMVKKLVGGRVRPIPGLAVETTVVAPVAATLLAVMAVQGTASFGFDGYGLLLASTGIVTAIPLLLFATSARHLSMVALGMVQFLSPIAQFLLGWLVLDEPMPVSRWAGFILVWIAVLLFIVDGLQTARRSRR